MGLKEKVVIVLTDSMEPEYLRLEDDDGISGYVVARKFKKKSTLDRQMMIDDALGKAEFSKEERRRIVMIAGLTPEEFSAVGAPIRLHELTEKAGTFRFLLRGGIPDGEYVRDILSGHEGVRASEPKPVAGASGILVSFSAKGTKTNPLTRERVLKWLQNDRYIEVMPNV